MRTVRKLSLSLLLTVLLAAGTVGAASAQSGGPICGINQNGTPTSVYIGVALRYSPASWGCVADVLTRDGQTFTVFAQSAAHCALLEPTPTAELKLDVTMVARQVPPDYWLSSPWVHAARLCNDGWSGNVCPPTQPPGW